MYVEISPRQTGKTTRLIQAAIGHAKISSSFHSCVVARNHDQYNRIQDRLTAFDGFVEVGMRVHMKRKMESVGYDGRVARWFIDEFDFFDDHALEIIPMGYYSTTLSRPRTLQEWHEPADFLTRLVHANGGQYDTYILSYPGRRSIQELEECYFSPKSAEVELLNHVACLTPREKRACLT